MSIVKTKELSTEELAQLPGVADPLEPELGTIERALLLAKKVGCHCDDASSDTPSE